MFETLKNDVRSLQQEMMMLRRDFHMHPELGMTEVRTADKIMHYLKELDLHPVGGIAQTGVACMIEGNGKGKTLLLRADMDALPILEKTDVPFRSQNDGVMHACAHDGHMAILLAAGKLLTARQKHFPGNIKLVFQPGEEGLAGAFFMIHEGVLENPKVDAALGLHLFSTFPTGQIRVREGDLMASVDQFTLEIHGKSGHGAMPESGIDAVHIAGHVITGLQGIVARELPAQSPAVIHIGKIHGGTAQNIIADNVVLSGSVRTLNEKTRTHVEERMNTLLNKIVSAFGGTCTFTYTRGYPILRNDPGMTQLIEQTAKQVVGSENVITADPIMGSEDMAFFLEKVPGCFFFVGAGNEEKRCRYPHHSELFNFDEDALVVGLETLVRGALTYLNTHTTSNP
ncbi:MAG: amidohydrolase [Desulfobacterales bacterium]